MFALTNTTEFLWLSPFSISFTIFFDVAVFAPACSCADTLARVDGFPHYNSAGFAVQAAALEASVAQRSCAVGQVVATAFSMSILYSMHT